MGGKFFFLCENNAEKHDSYDSRRRTRGLRDRLGKGMDEQDILLLEQGHSLRRVAFFIA